MFENYSIDCLKLFKEAEKQRELLSHEYVGTEHLLLAILKDGSLESVFSKFNLDYDSFFKEVKMTLSPVRKKIIHNTYTPLLKRVILSSCKDENITSKDILYHLLDEGEGVAIRILISMGIDIDLLYNYLKENITENTDLEVYKVGKLLNEYVDLEEKVIGRDKEINLIIETLFRKKKNNPLLIGDAGVGKSAIVEELARRIVKGEVPEKLIGTKIVSLEMGSLISGTRYRGEFEEKLTNIIKEVENNKNIILFIDEIHTMANAGAADGAVAAGDILKPYLARGDIKCIGATTKEEYEKYITKDKALTRRFEIIFVEEPSEEETFNILKNVKDEYVKFHHISIDDSILKSLIHLTNVYFPSRKNPDKSLELLDSVMSYVKLQKQSLLISEKEKNLKEIEILKIKDVENGNFKSALSKNIKENKLKKELVSLKNNSKLKIKPDDIIDVLEYKNNIIINKDRFHNITTLNGIYESRLLNIIKNTLKKDGVKSFKLVNAPENFISDIGNALKYKVFKLTSDKSFDKLISYIKYYPSLVITCDENNPAINELLNKIYKDKMLEYNDEYINFSNAIIFVNSNNKNFGFNENSISNVPYDDVLLFKDKLSL